MASEPPIQASRHRVRVFVDFWNFSLSMRDVESAFPTDWVALGRVLADSAVGVVAGAAVCEYQGLSVYGSYDPDNSRLHRWATTVLPKLPGISVSMVELQRKRSAPRCPSCRKEIRTCPSCGGGMRGMEEKGVDVRMATDMISLAWVDNYDIAVLVSSDRDFVPVAAFLETRGIKVIHGAFPPKGAHLTAQCWGAVNIPDLRERFRR